MSALTRKRLARVVAFPRAIGDAASDAAALNQTFHATDYVPPAIQDDYATGLGYYNQFKGATKGLSVVNGTVQMSDQAANDALIGITAALQVVPVVGQAFAIFMALAPMAGSGPGTCANPPAGPAPSQLKAWEHYSSWESRWGKFPIPAPGSFEEYANVALKYNQELRDNCFMSRWVEPGTLLATLIASWNATHAGPTRTITRRGLNPGGWGTPPGYDPIAQALEGTTLGGPNNVAVSFSINAGPEIVPGPKVIHLQLRPPTPSPPIKAAAPPGKAPTSPHAVALVATLALAGAAGFWVWKRKKARLPIVPRKLARTLHLGR